MTGDMKTVSVRMPAEQYGLVDTIARIEEMPVAETVRRAVDLMIEEKRHDPDFRERVLASVEKARKLLAQDLAAGKDESDALQSVIDELVQE